MKYEAETVEDYLNAVPEERKEALSKLRKTLLDNLPKGFEELISYGMPSYSVPFSLYPQGYHCNPTIPLPFISFASQKNFIGFYHLGIYSDEEILFWFTEAYQKLNIGRLDMGKSCIRFKKIDRIPYELLGELVSKITVEQWIAIYEKHLKR